MSEVWTGISDVLRAMGPVGLIVTGAIVAPIIAVLLVAHFRGLGIGAKAEEQKLDFQDNLIKMVDALRVSETAIREDAERIRRENDALEERLAVLQAQIALLREQLARYIGLLRAVKEGRLAPDEIAPEILGAEAGAT